MPFSLMSVFCNKVAATDRGKLVHFSYNYGQIVRHIIV